MYFIYFTRVVSLTCTFNAINHKNDMQNKWQLIMSPHLYVKSVIWAVRRIQASQILQLDPKNHLLMHPHKVFTARLSFTADLGVIYSISVVSSCLLPDKISKLWQIHFTRPHRWFTSLNWHRYAISSQTQTQWHPFKVDSPFFRLLCIFCNLSWKLVTCSAGRTHQVIMWCIIKEVCKDNTLTIHKYRSEI